MKSIFDNPTSPQDNTFASLAMLGPLGAKPLLCPFWQGQHRPSNASAPIYWHCPSPKHKWSKTLPLNINTREAVGPDGVLGRVLKDSADELAEVFTTIYNMSLSTLWVSGCFKAATIVPVPQQSNVTCLNDCRPVALTPIQAKCLERLVIKHIKEAVPPTLDPYQFAYKENRSTEDAIAIVLHTLLEHLEQKTPTLGCSLSTSVQHLTQSGKQTTIQIAPPWTAYHTMQLGSGLSNKYLTVC